ncbi:putative bifunctional diguanylate cyclase/phosphodiesterase [Arhodomonas sp. SL1]|uniref:putative bifunctional diguanylate cyclase/phosphodiesterase n=1 Tax=Arhodomonas sp. SL1 TaxID=3425691 RepID=UPI003F88395C
MTEPPILFTGIAVFVLAVIWGTALNFAARERNAAIQAAKAVTADVADTYEAQVVRALREIDHTLKLVRYELEDKDPADVLDDLRARELLPPALLFTVRIIDDQGRIMASTDDPPIRNVADRDYFQDTREKDGIVIGRPRADPANGEQLLHFARALERDDGSFSGATTLSVPASYFVSGYEPQALGEDGVLAMLGTDGIFRARRTGERISAGEGTDYQSLVSNDSGAPVALQINPWDEVHRYTVARKLFDFPVAIVVGLSRAEQLAAADQLARSYLWRAGIASVLALATVILLGRLSWKLHQARARAAEERVAHAQRVEYLAYHDNLTGLPNRALFTRLLTDRMRYTRRYGGKLALLFLDLDRFKNINDSLGHDAGDELLQEMGTRLEASVRESDTVARLGGDEFVVLLPQVDSGNQVVPVAEKILAAVGRPFTLVGQEFRVTVSIGVTLYPDDGEDEQTLMKNADVAMYHAKEQGKNNFQFYSEELNQNSLERLALESSLRNALERGEFRLFYQAKESSDDGHITGMEALLRWEHPELGLILPMQFIPLAEETGLIVPIGRWVFRTACQQNVAWQAEGFPPLRMAVNLSARQFLDENLFHDIRIALEETGMDPELLELEITESMIMRDMTQTLRVLNALKEMGVRIAIDDFGTGYSSLSTLKDFPLDTIKIDRSFIHDIIRSSNDKGLTDAVLAVGKTLSLTVVAEGVETREQAEYLRERSCDEFQGFYVNEPLPAEEFARLIRKRTG